MGDRPEPLPLDYRRPAEDAKPPVPVNFWVRVAIFIGVALLLVYASWGMRWF